MSIGAAPKVDIDTLKNLQANKMYFLSATTGQVKEASIWMRMKCAIGFSSARKKVANLVDAVRTSLLAAAEQTGNKALDDAIRTVDLAHMVKGSVIKDVLANFSVNNADKLLKSEAKKVARGVAGQVAGQLITKKCGLGSIGVISSIIQHALKPVANDIGALPVTNFIDGTRSLDNKTLVPTMKQATEDVQALINDIAMDKRLSVVTIDKHYAKHIIDTLYNKDGTRNDKTIDDLKTPIQVKVDVAFHLNETLDDNNPQIVYRDLKNNKGVDPEQKVADILSFCEGNKELEDMAMELMPNLCEDSNHKLRSDETIKKRLAGLKQNLEEIHTLEKTFPGCANGLKEAVLTLGGKQFPQGLLTRIAEFIGGSNFDMFANLNSLSSAEDIYEGLDQFYSVMDAVGKEINPNKEFEAAGEKEVGGPQANATRMAATTLAIAKMGPALKARLPGILQGEAFKKMTSCMDAIFSALDHKDLNVVGGDHDKRKAARDIVYDQFDYLNCIVSTVNVDREAPLELESGGDADINAEPTVTMRIILSEAADKKMAAKQQMPLLNEE